jgi:hypothetical protein
MKKRKIERMNEQINKQKKILKFSFQGLLCSCHLTCMSEWWSYVWLNHIETEQNIGPYALLLE